MPVLPCPPFSGYLLIKRQLSCIQTVDGKCWYMGCNILIKKWFCCKTFWSNQINPLSIILFFSSTMWVELKRLAEIQNEIGYLCYFLLKRKVFSPCCHFGLNMFFGLQQYSSPLKVRSLLTVILLTYFVAKSVFLWSNCTFPYSN